MTRRRSSVDVLVALGATVVVAAASLSPTPVHLDVAALVAVCILLPWQVGLTNVVVALTVGSIASDPGSTAVAVGLAVATAVIGRRPVRTDSPPSRFALRLGAAVALSVAGGAVEHLVVEDAAARAGNALVDHGVTLLVGVGLGLTIATLLGRRASRGAATTAAAAMTLSGLLVLATSTYWDGRDRDLLALTSTAVVGGLGSAIEEDLNQLSEKVNTTGRFAPDTFVTSLQGQFGNPSLTAAQLVEFTSSGTARVTAVTSRVGFDLDDLLTTWIEDLPPTEIGGADAFAGVPSFLGVVELPDSLGGSGYHLAVAIPLAPLDGVGPQSVVFALSVADLGRAAIAPTLADEGRVEVEVAWRTPAGIEALWGTDDDHRSGAIDESLPESVAGTVLVESISLRVDGELITVSRRTDQLGTAPAFRRLALAVESLIGLLITLAILLGADQSFRRERERLRREALLAAALEGSPGWTAIVDDDDRVVISNEDHYAVAPGALVVDSPLFAGDPDIVRELERLLVEARAGVGGSLQHHHSDVTDQSHAMRIFQIGVRPLPDPRLSFVQCVDVTEQRDRAMRSAQSERMEAIGVLAGSLAHDFNNLLFITLGYLQMLEQQPVVAADDTARTFVARAVEAVERGAIVAKSLLSFARSQPLEAESLDLCAYLDELRPLVEQAIGSAHTLTIETDGAGLDVLVDQGRLSSGLLNIVFNARDAIDGRGTITIRVSRGLRSAPEGEAREMVTIAVSDTGRGMSPEVAARAFEPFFTTKQVGSGTGLGLSTVYSFAQQSGGWATIESAEGIGTTVAVHLPPAAGAGTSRPAVADGVWSAQRVLVIDDEPALADLVAAWLGDLGLTTRIATTPAEALAAVEEFAPQLVVSDANLRADMDGLELARRIVEQRPSTVIVFMTGFSDRIKGLQAAGVAVLAKPFTRDDLVRVLSEHVGIRN